MAFEVPPTPFATVGQAHSNKFESGNIKKDQENPDHFSWLRVVDDVRTIIEQSGAVYIPDISDILPCPNSLLIGIPLSQRGQSFAE